MPSTKKNILGLLFIFIASFSYANPISNPNEVAQHKTFLSKKEIRKNKKAKRKAFRKKIKTALQNNPNAFGLNLFVLIVCSILFAAALFLIIPFSILGITGGVLVLSLILIGCILGIVFSSIAISNYSKPPVDNGPDTIDVPFK